MGCRFSNTTIIKRSSTFRLSNEKDNYEEKKYKYENYKENNSTILKEKDTKINGNNQEINKIKEENEKEKEQEQEIEQEIEQENEKENEKENLQENKQENEQEKNLKISYKKNFKFENKEKNTSEKNKLEKKNNKSNSNSALNLINYEKKDTNKTKSSFLNEKDYLITINADYTKGSFISEINFARQNCKSYSNKIRNFKKKIEYDEVQKENFISINYKKVFFSKELNSFDKASNYLENLHSDLENKFQILKNLEIIDELKIPFPNEDNKKININNQKKFLNKNYLNSHIDLLKKKFEGKFYIVDYFFDICFNDPEVFVFLNTIGEYDYENVEEDLKNENENENNKMLNLLFNEDIKYISVNHKKLDKDFCLIYLVFAK